MRMDICLHICLCIVCLPSDTGGQKMELDPLRLEALMIVSHHFGVEIKPWSFGRAVNALKY